jgi:hypothetical protein
VANVTYRQQYRKAKGRLYGPYWCAEWRDGGRVKTRHIGRVFKRIPEDDGKDRHQVAAGYELFEGDGRNREAWLLLGYSAESPPDSYDVVRKRVWNLLAAKTRPVGVKAEIQSAWEHLQRNVWPTRKRATSKT